MINQRHWNFKTLHSISLSALNTKANVIIEKVETRGSLRKHDHQPSKLLSIQGSFWYKRSHLSVSLPFNVGRSNFLFLLRAKTLLTKLPTYLDPSVLCSLAMKCKRNSKLLVVVVIFLVYGQISRGEYDGKFFVLFNANLFSSEIEQEM